MWGEKIESKGGREKAIGAIIGKFMVLVYAEIHGDFTFQANGVHAGSHL